MEKVKAKWTWIDTVIVLVAAAVLAAGAYVLKPSGISEKKKVTVTVMIAEKDEEVAAAMNEGDKVILSLTERDSGTVTAVKAEPSKRLTYNSIEGNYDYINIENKEDIYVTIEADCNITDTAAMTGSTDIKVGKQIPVRGKGYAANGYIISMD